MTLRIYDTDAAISGLNQEIDRCPSDEELKLRRSILGLELDRTDLIDQDPFGVIDRPCNPSPRPVVHRSLPPGPCGPCSLSGQRAPEFFTEQNGGRPMTRAMEQSMDAPARVLRLPRVQARTGLARSTIYVRVADGSFPQPIRLGARAVGWIESEVDAWIREQIAASRSSAE